MAAATGSRLTRVAIITRKTIRYTIYFFVFVIILRAGFDLAVRIYRSFIPKKQAPPTVGFGSLATINFPEITEELPDFEYTLETATGDFPAFPDRMRVYFMPKNRVNLFSRDNTIAKAKGLGFTTEPIELTSAELRFNHQTFPSSLEINIATGVFSMNYNLAADSSPLATRVLTEEEAESRARSILSSARSNPGDLTGQAKVEFLKQEEQNLVKAVSQSEADLVKVSLFRKPLDEEGKYPSVTGNPNESNVWFILSGAGDITRQAIAAEYHHFPIDLELVETYPIKSAALAYEELQAGAGYIASLGLNQDGKITIRQAYLAYFDPSIYSEFYQPVIAFEGDDNFIAYVPAVTAEYYGKSTSSQ